MACQLIITKKGAAISGRSWILTAWPAAHEFCAQVSGAFATCILEFVDEIYPSWDVLFELAESEETAVDHPGWAPRWIGLDTVL